MSNIKRLIKKILKEETEEVLMIPSARYFGGVEGLRAYIEKSNIKRWSLDDNLDLRNYEGDLIWLEGLVSVSGYMNLRGAQIKSLGNLQSVGLSLSLYGTQIKSLPKLQSVGGYLNLYGTPIKSLPKLQSVGRSLYLKGTQIESLPKLQSVGNYLNLYGTQIKSFGNLKSVGDDLLLNKYLSEKYTDEEIRSMINVGGDIERG
jgi:hypothetical protein